jgi:hypothetical protein
MPLGASKEQLQDSAKSVFEFSATEGYSYSDRVHIRVFDKNGAYSRKVQPLRRKISLF